MLTTTYSNKLAEVTASCNEKIAQLQVQLESKDGINKKWSVETKAIVESLEKLVASLKRELNKSKKENKRLRSELEDQQNKFEQFKHFLQLITNDVDKISQMAQENSENVV